MKIIAKWYWKKRRRYKCSETHSHQYATSFKLDGSRRTKHYIIQHLSETDIENPDDGMTLTTDVEKIHQICKIMEHDLSKEAISTLYISRIGKPREGMSWMIKIVFQSMEERDAFTTNSNKMKNAPEIWRKVYIKNEQTPLTRKKTRGYIASLRSSKRPIRTMQPWTSNLKEENFF